MSADFLTATDAPQSGASVLPLPVPAGVSPRVGVELARLVEGGQTATFHTGTVNGECRHFVVYHAVAMPARVAIASASASPVEATTPATIDIIVPIPHGYPGAMIDLAGLPAESPLLSRLQGGGNVQGEVVTDNGRRWRLASYHPHQNGGGPPWNPMRHGFHTYFDHLLAWLGRRS